MIFKKKKPEQSLDLIIGPESNITGTVSTNGIARVDGTVEGIVKADWLIVGEAARIKGMVIARGTMVAGSIEGNIKSEEMVEIKSRATVEGDIHTTKLTIAEGALFDGRSFMKRKAELESPEFLLLEKAEGKIIEQG